MIFKLNLLLVAVICLNVSLSFAYVGQFVFPIRQNLVCENEELEIKCGKGEEIIIDYASYGSNEKNDCNNITGSDCSARNSFSQARDICNFKNSCVVKASDSIFGNPCEGVFKFLKIKWRCIPSSKIIHSEAVVCEGDEFKVRCPLDKVMVIRKANFGAVELYDKQIVCNSYQSTSCLNPDSLNILRRNCERRGRCMITANIDTFGDHCQDYNRYLYVQYKCIPHQTCDNLV